MFGTVHEYDVAFKFVARLAQVNPPLVENSKLKNPDVPV
jgi:hypothetical protein